MTLSSLGLSTPAPVSFGEKIWRINWGLILVLTAIAAVGVVALYSAAGGRFDPWAGKHAMRYGVALGLCLIVALINPKIWLALAWPIYVVSMVLLVAVDVIGKIEPYCTVSGYVVTPVLGVVPPDLPLEPHEHEVADWFEAPLEFLLDPQNQQRRTALFQGVERHYYEIMWNDRRIWGATAAIIVNLSRRLQWC